MEVIIKKTQNKKSAIVCGASQGIGLALIKSLLLNKNFKHVIATHRKTSNTDLLLKLKKLNSKKLLIFEMEATNAVSIKKLCNNFNDYSTSLDLLINCIGFLHNETVKPEKSIEDINIEALLSSFQINTLTSLLLAKHFKLALLNNKTSSFISLSAKVGSIQDNKTGGWYSYRASKAALNMIIKNLSIEFNRLGKKCNVFAIHPGTTDTQLTEPYLKNAKKKYIIHSAEETATNILKIALNENVQNFNGKFISWDGEEIPW